MVEKMSAVVSPASLQQICQAAAASWLLDWSGLVGQISARAASMQTQRNRTGGWSMTPSTDPSRGNRIYTYQSFYGTTNLDHEAKEVRSQADVYRKIGRSRCRKKHRTDSKTVALYPRIELPEYYEDSAVLEYLGYCSYGSDNVHKKTTNPTSLQTNIRLTFDKKVLEGSARSCSLFLKHFLPPLLVNQIIDLAWKRLSRLVSHTEHSQSVEQYQVADWVRRAPALLQLCTRFPSVGLALNISGIPDSLIEDVLVIINQYFSFKTLNSLVLPKVDFKKKQLDISVKCKQMYKDIVLGASLTSVTLNNELCDDGMLSTLSQIPLKELTIGGNSVSEKGIINDLCALPVETVHEAKNIISSGYLEDLCVCPLRKSLQKLEMSFQRLASSVFHIIPAIFPELRDYNPHRNVVQCLENFERLIPLKNNNTLVSSQTTTKLIRLNVGNASRATLNMIAKICPQLQELVLTFDSGAEDNLIALENFRHLSHLEILYFPSLPASQPKLDANILQTVIHVFREQLKGISLTGFNVSGSVLRELSQLPELYHLKFTDCWLSSPTNLPHNPFPTLGKVSLNFLPANSVMRFFTMGGNVHTLHLDLKGLEWGSNPLTDSSIKALASSGIFKSLQTFTATSSYLTRDALRTLASMPCMKVVGYLSSWGLTEEELCCVTHSSPQHILCYQ
ncbi:uncharacterized protein [Palaemon carinicauda]|uniref:uncharacterized protein n=1 Tax=Palaemon carinicauda TaxID=392227 RepID=UPI0035B58A04